MAQQAEVYEKELAEAYDRAKSLKGQLAATSERLINVETDFDNFRARVLRVLQNNQNATGETIQQLLLQQEEPLIAVDVVDLDVEINQQALEGDSNLPSEEIQAIPQVNMTTKEVKVMT